MSRVGKKPIAIPSGVTVKLEGKTFVAKGPKGTDTFQIPDGLNVTVVENTIYVATDSDEIFFNALSGTVRAKLNNICIGVASGYQIKLLLVGVGFKASLQGKVLNLALGYSHPIEYHLPSNITIEVSSPTEILVKGFNKHHVGQTAANIRRFRPPELYKGKGIRYSDEQIVLKEAKKK